MTPPEVSTEPETATTIPRLDVRLGQVPPGLKIRRPYEQGKIPVVLVHGLWGFPHQWDRMVECLESDPGLRRRYQFWLFSYASGDSIPFSAHLLRQSLRQTRLLFDPKGTDKTFDRMVVIGHSLGGILAKMMAHESTLRLWQTVSDLPVDKIAGPQKDWPAPPAGVLLRTRSGSSPDRLHCDPSSWQPACQRLCPRSGVSALRPCKLVP